jgi:hypothetical protein
MGGRRRLAAWIAAGVAALVLGGSVAYVASTGLTPRSRFEHWLRGQPGLGSVAMQPGPRPDGDVARPTAEVTTKGPLTTARVERFMRALEGYAGEHGEATFYTVQLHHGADTVLAEGSRDGNVRLVRVLRSLRTLPDLSAVDIGISPYPPHATGVLTTGSDLVNAATSLARSAPAGDDQPDVLRGVGLSLRVEGQPHSIAVHGGAAPTDRAARAFRLAARLEGRSPVQLVVAASGADGTWTELHLDGHSTTAPRTRSAVNAIGFGMSQHHERVPGGAYADHDTYFDTAAWRAAVLPAVRAVPGVRAVGVSDPVTGTPVVLDVRVDNGTRLDRLAAAAPDSVDRVQVHTAPTAPDYERDDALAPDPETECPGARVGTNTAFSGPGEALRGASSYLVALAKAAPAASCLHWAEPGLRGRPNVQTAYIRIPLQRKAWKPVLDLVHARLADAGSAHPGVYLLLDQAGVPWTATLHLSAHEAPYAGALGEGSPPNPENASAPLVAYWQHLEGG